MALTREGVRAWLEASGRSVVEGPDDALVFTLEGATPLFVAALVSGDGTIFQLRTVGLYKDEGQEHAVAVQALLLDLNRLFKMVKFAYDPSDGEVVAWVDLYAGTAGATARQLDRCLSTLSTVVLPQRARIRALATTGEDPGEDAAPAPPPGPMVNFRGEAGEA